jgi:SAM-dependent methyltransferase
MWTVRLYILLQSILNRHPKLKNWVANSRLYQKLPPTDRRYLTQHVLPALASAKLRRVLFVGCKAYTARYGQQLIRAAVDYWTTDIDPAATIWGERDRHIVCDIARIDDVCPAGSFDAVLLNGVIGHGVDDEREMNRALTAIAHILRPNGILLIGWNSTKQHPDPMELDAITTYFRHECMLGLPVRKTFTTTDHVYDWLLRTNVAEATARTQAVSGDLVKS